MSQVLTINGTDYYSDGQAIASNKAWTTQEQKANAILTATSLITAIPLFEIFNKCRKRELVNARQIAQYLIKRYTNLPLEKIGNMTGGKDHSTVLYSIKTIEGELTYDKELKHTIELIEKGF